MRTRREIVENLVHEFVNAKIAVEEVEEIFEEARRYRALYRFVDDTDCGQIEAVSIFTSLGEDDPTPQIAGLEVDEDGGQGGVTIKCGQDLDTLADFLDKNRHAGKSRELRELSAGLLRATGRSPDA